MAEEKPTNKAAKEAAKATLIGLIKPEVKKEKAGAVAVKAPFEVQKAEAAKEVSRAPEPKPEAAKAEVKPEVKPEAKSGTKPEAKKEADSSKEFVDAIMAEMSLKGGSKKRLVKMLAEKYSFDKQKVLFRLRRALITERYAAEHAEAGGAGH